LTNHTVLDLFAGAGGFGLGFKSAGLEVPFSLEIDTWACDTLRHNNPDMLTIQEDIRNIRTPSQIKKICPFIPSVIIGGPPCQGFSISGSPNKDPKDPRNTLFIEFAKWVQVLEPTVFIMENVKGLLSRKNIDGKPVISIIIETFEKIGYTVAIWLLNAAEYGVPQVRERVFIVGYTRSLAPPQKTHTLTPDNQITMFAELEDKPVITIWDAISDLPPLGAGEGDEEAYYATPPETDYQRQMRQRSTVLYNHVAMKHSKRMVERFNLIEWGKSSASVSEEHRPRQRNGGGKLSTKVYDQNNRRLHPDKPSHTIAASFYANFIHPHQHRNLTAREGARIQSFPDTYRFLGKKTVVSHKLLRREGRHAEAHLCQYNQIGNAVPPLLAQKIAEHILEECL
jgi:DNA (cytosine-5)-methyltransferase 1